ncbi:alanine racemase [Candidatus Latescibacterota bacterium]
MVLTHNSDTVAITNLAAYKQNLQKIKSYIGDSVELMAVVKGNAYGHGMTGCAQTAIQSGASWLGVAVSSEGVELREAGITAPILVMTQESREYLSVLIKNGLTISLTSRLMLDELETILAAEGGSCTVHINVDTGMGRVGVTAGEAEELVEAARNIPEVTVEGIYTHFCCADEKSDPFSQRQIELFKGIVQNLEQKGLRPEIVHMCNSAGTLRFPEAHFDLVRPGIMTYGLIPYSGSSDTLVLEPVLSLKSKISFIKDVYAGTSISYGSTFITKRPSRLATVPIGYADGYNRRMSNRGHAIVNGIAVPVAGRITMDQTVFDITDAGEVHVGDTITLIGTDGDKTITVEDHAHIAETISHEIVTGITGRVSRAVIQPA